jgi:hypothetical protein
MTPNPIKKLEHVKSHIRQSWPPPEAGVRSIQPIKPNNEQPSEMIISQYECLNFMRVWCGLTTNIGYPKLFMICERAIGKPAQQIVNNFAANRAATVSDWPFGFIFGIGSHRFPAPAGQAC